MKSPSRINGNARPIDPCGSADSYFEISSEFLSESGEIGSVTNTALLSNQFIEDTQGKKLFCLAASCISSNVASMSAKPFNISHQAACDSTTFNPTS